MNNHIIELPWHSCGSPGALAEGRITELAVAGKAICLLKKADVIYAFAACCPHAGAPLCEGWLDAQGRVVCPLHKYRFNPMNGYNTSGEGYKLKTHPVKVAEGCIFVQF